MHKNQGTLYVVATPIGNLEDISFRALKILKEVTFIAAEDTRHSGKLLKHFNITTKLVSLHEYNENTEKDSLLERLAHGESMALISDAGTPLISDPGYALIAEAHRLGIKVSPIPGACAAIAAMSVAGLPSHHFSFEGFLPAKKQERKNYLADLKHETRTLIFYEAPHRILDTLTDLSETFGGERFAVIAREMTKIYETIKQGTLEELVQLLTQDKEQRLGEFVVLIHGAEPKAEKAEITLEVEQVLEILLKELPVKQAVNLTAQLTGARKNQVYDMALRVK